LFQECVLRAAVAAFAAELKRKSVQSVNARTANADAKRRKYRSTLTMIFNPLPLLPKLSIEDTHYSKRSSFQLRTPTIQSEAAFDTRTCQRSGVAKPRQTRLLLKY
jgi:hypothetical protein